MKMTTTRPPIKAERTPILMESSPSDGPTVTFWMILTGRRKRFAQHDGELGRLVMGEIAGDLRVAAADPVLDAGRGMDHAVKNDGKLLADVRSGDPVEDLGALGVEGDGYGRLVVLIDADLCLLQAVSGQERLAVDQDGRLR